MAKINANIDSKMAKVNANIDSKMAKINIFDIQLLINVGFPVLPGKPDMQRTIRQSESIRRRNRRHGRPRRET